MSPAIMVDQEGGAVRRIPGSPARSAATMGAGDPAATRPRGGRGSAAGRVGVGVDLAPVADVAGPGSILARMDERSAPRGGGGAPRGGLRAGSRQAGILASAKHFPGLGTARVNTDDARWCCAAHGRPCGRRRAAVRGPYRPDVPMVMTSSAIYPALASGVPAMLSRTVVTGELRGRLGFGGW